MIWLNSEWKNRVPDNAWIALYSALLRPFDWILLPFGSSNPLLPLALVSLFAGVVLLLVFAKFSDQERLRMAKNRIRAHLLELRLYGHDAHLVWAAEKRIACANLVYLGLLLKPLVVTLPIFAWMLLGLKDGSSFDRWPVGRRWLSRRSSRGRARE